MLDSYRFVSILQDELCELNQQYVLCLNTPLGVFKLDDQLAWKIIKKHCIDYLPIVVTRYDIRRRDVMILEKLISINTIRHTIIPLREYAKSVAQSIDRSFFDFEKQQVDHLRKDATQ